MSARSMPIMHQHLYDRTYRPVGHCLRGGRSHDFVERLRPYPVKARRYVARVTNELLLRAQLSATQHVRLSRRETGDSAVLYFVECDALALVQELTLIELEAAARALGRLRATLVLRLYDGFESLLLRDVRALFAESLCRIRDSGVRIALGTAGESASLVRLLQSLGFIDYLFLHLGHLPASLPSVLQAGRVGEIRDLMVEQINANSVLFVASGVDTEYASEMAKFLPFTYWMGSCLSAQDRI